MERMPPSRRPAHPDRRRATGRAAEEAAARYLGENGFRILERNWRCRTGELDLIALDGETLVFVEVRSRRGSARFGTAIEAITPRKCAQVRSVAHIYLSTRNQLLRQVRFDVVAVTFGPSSEVAELKHIPGAF
ncbi:YraN family protein [Cohnella zeiphila]|nr:YraN family protein [Cohnella zeiphila]